MLSKLLQQIETTIPSLDGWCTAQRATELAAMVVALRPTLSVCIGVWGGRDVLAMALAHKHNGLGKVLAIDPWKATASIEGQSGANAEWWANQEMHELVYSRFLQTVDTLGLKDYIDVRRQRSDEAEVPPLINILVTDGNHGPQAINDVERFAPKVVLGGIVYMDDIAWEGGAVASAIMHLYKLGYKELYKRDTGAFFQHVK